MAKGPLLHLLVAASIEQMENFGAFEAEIAMFFFSGDHLGRYLC